MQKREESRGLLFFFPTEVLFSETNRDDTKHYRIKKSAHATLLLQTHKPFPAGRTQSKPRAMSQALPPGHQNHPAGQTLPPARHCAIDAETTLGA